MDDVAIMTILALLGTSYVLTSLVLFKFPGVLHGHRKNKVRFRCQHISHRGGAGEHLENTIAAFDHAVSTGTDMLEIDLQLTKDGVVVVSHDDNLSRTAGVNAHISGLNYDELPLLNRRIRVDFDAVTNYCEVPSDADRRIPKLVELFERYPRTLPVNLDIKSNSDTLIRKVSQLISEHGREDSIAWGNFSEVVRRKCCKENPRVATYFSSSGVIKLLFLTYSGLLPFVPLRDSFYEMFLPSVILKKNEFAGVEFSRKPVLRFGLWIVDKLLIRKFLFEHLEKRGIQTFLWVLNEEEDFDRAFQLGASGVMTDYPSRLRAFLDANPQYNKK